jgi:nitric oxide reductase subunit B
LVLWIALNFFPVGWPQLNAVFEHGYAYARSGAFNDTMVRWQWLRIVGDIVFAARAVLMAVDFLVKLRPLLPQSLRQQLFAVRHEEI